MSDHVLLKLLNELGKRDQFFTTSLLHLIIQELERYLALKLLKITFLARTLIFTYLRNVTKSVNH